MQRHHPHHGIAILLMLTLLLNGASPARRAYAATINVTTFADNLEDNGDCSLREAIRAANIDSAVDACPAGSGADTIMLSAGTYTLSLNNLSGDEDTNLAGDLDILSSLTIKGIDANTTQITTTVTLDRVMQILPGATATLAGLSISHGHSGQNGGAIHNSGALTLNGVTVKRSIADGNGGGIHNSGALIIHNSVIDANTADGNGGGIQNVSGSAMVYGSIINNNVAIGNGGGIHNSSTLVMDNVWTHDNLANGSGAGIYNTGQATISHIPIHDNYAGLNGGNIYNSDSGGLGSLAITQSAVSHGFAFQNGGGIYNDGSLNLTNTTIRTNRAALGDGIYNVEALLPMSLTNVTLADNTNDPVFAGEGLYNTGAGIAIKNTLIANNGSSGDCAGPVASGGYNLEYGDTCGLGATGDITGTNPLLGPFQNNGGTTSTYALLLGSPAINAGTNAGCPAVDQRGMKRPHGASCDIGAYEANYAPQASADSYSTDEDTPLIVATPAVLSNDSDPDNDVITATLVTAPAHGALTFQPNGAFSYTPAANYYGEDSFSYRVSDGSLISASAPVTLTIHSVNDPPVAADDTASTSINSVLTIPVAMLLGNDTDLEGDPLSISSVRGNSAHGGRVTLSGLNVVYTPPVHFSGVDTLIYTLSDGNGGTASGTVTISVSKRLLYLPVARR